MRSQNTIRVPVHLDGVGLHNGLDCQLIVEPAPENTGIVFIRADLDGQPEVRASHDVVIRRSRHTVLANGACEVNTVEHFLAAASGLRIDNLRVSLYGAELPAAGGCAQVFVDLLERAGVCPQAAARETLVLSEPILISDGGAQLEAIPNEGGLKISYSLEYPPETPLPSQSFSFTLEPDCFKSEIAPARTFCLESEARMLQENGFGLGANFKNTLVVGKNGVIENDLRFDDEYARHKVLDLIGDLALLGCDLEAHIVASKSGHAANVLLVEQLSQRCADLQDETK